MKNEKVESWKRREEVLSKEEEKWYMWINRWMYWDMFLFLKEITKYGRKKIHKKKMQGEMKDV